MAEFHPQVTNMSANDLRPQPSRNNEDRDAASRGWNCPSDELLASYVEGTTQPSGRARIESHLAKCGHCCGVVADVIKLQRLELPEVPEGLIRRSVAEKPGRSKRRLWLLVPIAAMSMAAVAIVAMLTLSKPERLSLPPQSAPAAPLIARSEPSPAAVVPHGTKVDELRSTSSLEPIPILTFPERGTAIRRELLKFEWKSVPKTRYYKIQMVTPEGDLVWESQAETSTSQVPRVVRVNDGAYFVWVSAYLDDGRVRRSAPVRFLVSAAR